MTPRRARRKPGENRERLLEAGLIEFGLFGYHGASTAAIAERAEVPQPHVYANFTTKQALFLACFELARDGVIESPAPDAGKRRERMIYQAVAALGDPSLRETVGLPLSELRAALGDGFEVVLAAAADSLLEHGENP